MKPTIGRIVIYRLPVSVRVSQRDHPAIVTAVYGDDTVDLTVFLNRATPYCAASVGFLDPAIGNDGESWHWPPRVDEASAPAIGSVSGCTLDDADILARTIYGEARGESAAGMVAVGWVVRNRLADPARYGKTIMDVCCRPRQFSCWDEGDPNRPRILAVSEDDHIFRECQQIANEVIRGVTPDPTHGATHYCRVELSPFWASGLTPCAVIGNHKFFNNVP
jgi:spore germination cell wall hydrolase CwlJ-like protein